MLGVAVGATVGAAIWLGSSDEEPQHAVPTTTTTDSTTSTSSSTTPTSTSTTTTTQACPPVQGSAADVDGDGCVEAVTISGERVTVGATTWRAGRPGDVAVVGDWDCDGRATVASLRASTGEVFVFDRWERALTVPAAVQVTGATALRATDPDGDGCATLVAERGQQAPVVVEVAA